MKYHTSDIQVMIEMFHRVQVARETHLHPSFEALTEEFLEVTRAMQDGDKELVLDELKDLLVVTWRMITEYWIQVQEAMHVTEAMRSEHADLEA